MNHIVTLEQLINISQDMIANAKSNDSKNLILSENICRRYEVLKNKKKLLNMFAYFKSARYLYNFPENISTTANYDLNMRTSKNQATSKVESAIERYLDKQILTTEIYNTLINLSYKLTYNKTLYLINTFLTHKSEEEIAELAEVSKTYLQNIKKSCIVKMWIDLEKYCQENE